MNKIEERLFCEPLDVESEGIDREEYEAQCVENRLQEWVYRLECEDMERKLKDVFES